jgi:tetratricopeptide (TPR) repeat protein
LDTADALLAQACLGGGLPVEAEEHLRLAGIAYSNDEVAEAHLMRASVAAPDHAAVLIGRYRFYFYKGRLNDALEVAKECLVKAARDNGLEDDWRQVGRNDADFGSFEAILPRFYLFTLKAYGYLNMRLGELDEGREVVMKLLELDPGDKIGAKVLLNVLNRMEMPEEDE